LVDLENPVLKSVDGVLYDRNTNTLLAYPAGRTGEYFVPEGTTCVLLDSFAANRGAKYQLHISAGVSVKMQWAEMVDGNGHITVYAPEGSEAERMARRCDCQFVPEGETVAPDDSNERKERSFQQWRLIFSFSSRSKGAHISKFVRGSKVVYLPDKIGKADVASLEKNAFLPDTAVLCSKRLFAKLAEANKLATVRAYLENGDLFLPDEGKYLKEFIKKNPVQVFEMLIEAEAMAAMESCLKEVKFAAAVMEAAMEVADRLGRIDIKAFLLDCQNRAASK
jgi:hypothetical protein